MASLIWILLAVGATSKMTWFFSRRRFDFSVRMIGRRMRFSGVSMSSSLVEAASLEGFGRVLADDQVIVPEQVVDVDSLGGEVLVVFQVADRELELLVVFAVDDERLSRDLQLFEHRRQRLRLDLG